MSISSPPTTRTPASRRASPPTADRSSTPTTGSTGINAVSELGGQISEFIPAGYVLFRLTRSDATEDLWAAAFDIGSGELRGDPFLVEADASEATIDRDRNLVFVMNPHRSNDRMVVRVGFDGKRRENLSEVHQGNIQFSLSPNGSRLAFTALPPDDGTTEQLWMRDLGRGIESQLTVYDNRLVIGGDGAYYPVSFSPGGGYLLYYALRHGAEGIYLTRLPEFTGRWKVSQGQDVESENFAPDGTAIYYVTGNELYRVAFREGPTPELGRPQAVGTLPDGVTGYLEIHPDGDSYGTVVDAQPRDGKERRRSIKVAHVWTAKLGGQAGR